MASPSDNNNQPSEAENNGNDEQAPQPSTSGMQFPPVRPWRRRPPSPPMSPPRVTAVARRAIRLARQYLVQLGRHLATQPPGVRVLLVADKALSCILQALRWAAGIGNPNITVTVTEGIESPGRPLGAAIRTPMATLLRFIRSAAFMAQMFLNCRLPENEDLICRLERYRLMLQQLQMPPVQRRRTPARPAATQRSTEAAGESSAPPVEESRVVTPPEQSSSSSSSSSSSEHAESGSEEVTRRYYSPPRIADQKRKEDEKKEKPVEEDKREDSETEGADRTALFFGERSPPPLPSPTHMVGAGTSPQTETEAEPAGGGAARARRPPAAVSKNLFNLFGLKFA